jgi:DASH complex subunit DAM1
MALTALQSAVLELIKPDMNQARANKCLIALVNRKIVKKENSTVRLSLLINFLSRATADLHQGTVLYHWLGTG